MKVRRSSHIYGHLIAALLSVHKMEGLKNPQTVLNGTALYIRSYQGNSICNKYSDRVPNFIKVYEVQVEKLYLKKSKFQTNSFLKCTLKDE